ncbi:uncharacterized protein LOC118279293 isoform X2 [Spodoptera frugiperda]|uniref:Uncharacterized protein LOC118279293 isoform X2 n=1 Tax=Spodoptera frugiperda TaxID=7108 RepID=A0A9R0DIA1_SPOFR|nr:uncharacterized protein LOC118279293 isoform X2 [Spodoptera frugiperda]
MTVLHLDKSTNTEDVDASSNHDAQTDLGTTTNMDLVKQEEAVKPRPITIAESKDLVCIDIENSIEPPTEKNEDGESGKLNVVTALKLNLVSQRSWKRKYTVMGMYNYVFGARTPDQNQSRLSRQLWRQEAIPPQPQQTVWTQYGPYPPNPGQAPPYPGYGDGAYQGAYGYDGRGPLLYDPLARNSFVRLVMFIVLVMLLATSGVLIIVLTVPEVKEFFRTSGWLLMFLAGMLLITVNCAMVCTPCARRPPFNIICLMFATMAMSIIAAKITSHFKTDVILYAFIATSAVTFLCVVLAYSNFDFTSYVLYIIGLSLGFAMVVCIVSIAFVATGTLMKPVIIVLLAIGTLIQIVVDYKNRNRAGLYEIIQNYHDVTRDE